MIDVLVLNYNDSSTTSCFVNKLNGYSCVRKILVVDNHSSDDSLKNLKKMENEKIIVVDSGKNAGYGAGNNFGILYLKKYYQSEYILLSNPDVLIEESVVSTLENFLRCNNDYVVAAPFMLNASGEKENHTAFHMPSKWEYIVSMDLVLKRFLHKNCGFEAYESQKNLVDVDALTGSLFMLNVDEFVQHGLFDENIFLYCEEVVLGKKIKKANKKMALLPRLSFIHNHSVSISKTFRSEMAKRKILLKSKRYVLKEYFHVNKFDLIFVYLFSFTTLMELKIKSFLDKIDVEYIFF